MKRARMVLILVVLALVLGIGTVTADGMTAGDLVAEATANILHVNVSVAKDLFDTGDYLFIDIREESETRMGYIPGAALVPRGLLEFRIASTAADQSTKIIIYCKSGGRGSLATYALKRMGYTNVINMDGGFTAWTDAGYPIDG